MPAPRDRFVGTKQAKSLLKGSGAVALLKPAWAKANEIRTGLTPRDKNRVYSVLDIIAYKARIAKAQENDALASDQVVFWRTVVDEATIDKAPAVIKYANDKLLTAIADSDSDILDAGTIALD